MHLYSRIFLLYKMESVYVGFHSGKGVTVICNPVSRHPQDVQIFFFVFFILYLNEGNTIFFKNV